MPVNKEKGVYYTPKILSNFLIDHIFSNYIKKECINILEPSVGDGRFIKPFLTKELSKKFQSVYLDIVEIDKNELEETSRIFDKFIHKNSSLTSFNQDFLNFKGHKYSLIIGNPPYISKKYLSKTQIDLSSDICKSAIPSFGEVKNIWPAFLLKSISFLEKDGVICFVLPSELLQVKYTKTIREYILSQFSKIEIFAFNELVFPNIEQDVVVLIGAKKATKEKNISFYQVDKLVDLKIPDYIKKHSNVHRKSLDKWTNYILNSDELNLIENIIQKKGLKPIKEYCTKAEVGIVTAANNFFILPQNEIIDKKLKPFSKSILKKGNIVKNLIELTNKDFKTYIKNNLPVNFVRFKDISINKLSKNAQLYIQEGVSQELNERYKMKLRKNWYHVPSVWTSEGLFIKRCHIFPRMIVNKANVLVTDAFYRVVTKEGYCIKKLSFSFYNTLTFILAELEGRYYGGGVLELIPSEFKHLVVPYTNQVSEEQFKELDSLFRKNENIEIILDYTDAILFPELDSTHLKKLREIWKKLLGRRLKDKFNPDSLFITNSPSNPS